MGTTNLEGSLEESLIQFVASYKDKNAEGSLEERLIQLVTSFEDNKLKR